MLKNNNHPLRKTSKASAIAAKNAATPMYKKLGIEPAEAGHSLLHDKNGLPVVPPAPKKKVPAPSPISNETVIIKATKPEDMTATKISNPRAKRDLPAKQVEDIPKEIKIAVPPAISVSPVLNIGNNEEHTWHSEQTTGKKDPNKDNDIVDVEALQGINPINEQDFGVNIDEHPIVTRLNTIHESLKHLLPSINDMVAFEEVKKALYGERGPLASVLAKIKILPKNESSLINEVASEIFGAIQLDISSREYDIKKMIAEDQDEEIISEEPADDVVDEPVDNEEEEGDVVKPFEIIETLEKNQLLILVGSIPVKVVGTFAEARMLVEQLIVQKNIPVDNIVIVKRLGVDFGVLISEG